MYKKPYTVCVIPARLESTRLKRKALVKIADKTLLELTLSNVLKCKVFDKIIVSTDSDLIINYLEQLNLNITLFKSSLELNTGSDRVYETIQSYPEAEIILNLQLDEPFISAQSLEKLVAHMHDEKTTEIATFGVKMKQEEFHDHTKVKLIYDKDHYAIYFSRNPIPFIKNEGSALDQLPLYKHVGVYAFRRALLNKFHNWKQSPLELSEGLEQLRIIENCSKIKVIPIEENIIEINTEKDLLEAKKLYKELYS